MGSLVLRRAAAPDQPADEFAGLDAVMARAAGENFPVALGVLPARLRSDLRAIYGYARLVDNLGDEYPGDRAAALDWLESQLDDLYAGEPPRHPVFAQLAPLVARLGPARTPFDRLLSANRLDQHKCRYATWDELREYCTLSANPVGHLVLAVFSAATPQRLADSDDVCTALQVLEHLQDVGEDAAAGRIYLPADDMARFGCTVDDLLAPVASPALRELVAFEAGRARDLLGSGRRLVASLRGWARLAIAGFVSGGSAGLDALQAARWEVLGATRGAGTARRLRRFATLYCGAVLRGALLPRPAVSAAPGASGGTSAPVASGGTSAPVAPCAPSAISVSAATAAPSATGASDGLGGAAQAR